MTDKNGMHAAETTVSQVGTVRTPPGAQPGHHAGARRDRVARDEACATFWDRIGLGLCVLSLLFYLFHSEAIRKFGGELSRLAGRL